MNVFKLTEAKAGLSEFIVLVATWDSADIALDIPAIPY